VNELLLVRHGETDWNREGRFQGHADPPLNDLGRRQAAELAAALANEEVTAVYTSPLRRAFETAELIASARGLSPVPVEALREVDVGSWQALTRAEVEGRFPQQFRRWIEYGRGWDDGETYEEMGERVIAAFRELAARHEGERIMGVTHGGPIRAVLALAAGIGHAEARRRGPAIGNCFVARFEVLDGNFRRID
jgi:broad specificity phosphatase PhoE